MIKRYLTTHIKQDLDNKIVFVTGPRQAGKTTVSKSITTNYDYLNYDSAKHRISLAESSWDRKKDLIIFDELHKMKQWKGWLKGIYDTEGLRPRILVTGSAKLNTYKKVGDSLAGRYFQYRLHPFDLKEIGKQFGTDDAFTRLWECSGFPEPFLKGSHNYYKRWKKTHTDIILRQDLIDLETVRDIQAIETLIELLKLNAGSTVSYANLARILEKDSKTIKRWLQLLENLYIIFKVTPYAKKITRSLLKEPKYYFYDYALIDDNDGAKLENIVAAALLKEIHYVEDLFGADGTLHFVKTKDGKEIDFLVVLNNIPCYLIEVKMSDNKPSKHFAHFDQYLPNIKKIQLVKNISREKTYPNGLEIKALAPWLRNINFAV